ncbi:MAG: PKD domain-containing protein [Candidatus Peribacteraceae bacterium]|nr:PKD domain-containing protein [Candidatus Peribacteraceae bacterium]
MVKFLSRLLIVTLMAGPVMASAATLDDYEGDIDTEDQSECLVLTKDLRLRSRDAKTEGEVSLLQDFLNTRGYLKAEPTGFFSVSTFAAVKAFQKEMKLRPTGFVSVLTRKAIEKVSCEDAPVTQTVSVSLKSNVTSYQVGDTIIFTAKVTENDGTPLTPQEGATVTLHQLSGNGRINDKDTMSYDRRNSLYVLRTDDHTTSDDIDGWTAFATVSKNGSSVGTSEKIGYRIIADEPYVSCSDSDGGKDYFNKGETEGISPSTGKKYSGSDICGTGTTYAVGQLVEHYCDGKYHTNTVYTCPYGCSNGACQRTTEPPIRVISPNGGEVWTEGNDYMMRWTPTAKQVPAMQTIDQYIIDEYGNNAITPAIGRTNTGGDGWAPRNVSGKFKLKICQHGTTNCDMSDDYFTITSISKNLPPVIDSISAPTTLPVGEDGRWFVYARDPENGRLTYSVDWGDGEKDSSNVSRAYENSAVIQTTTFTHAYATAGTYRPTFFVKDDAGQVQSTSASVQVSGLSRDTCRLDKLDGTNITGKPSATNRIQCLQMCDIYGPANLSQMSSKCMFMGQEIKRYEPRPVDNCRYDASDGKNIGNVHVDSLSVCYNKWDSFGNNRPGSKVYFNGSLIRTYVSASPASVQVRMPNGGEVLEIGTKYLINYSMPGAVINSSDPIRIYLEKYFDTDDNKKGVNSSQLIGTTDNFEQYAYTPSASLQTWPGLGSSYRIKVCIHGGSICDSSDRTFTIRTASNVGTNLPPVIDGLTAPTKLTAGQSGQWTVRAHDPENKPLTYAVAWGDEPLARQMNGIVMAAPGSSFVQTTVFTHTYATPGTYTPKFFVKDDAGQVQTTAASVTVTAVVPDEPPMRVIAPNGNEQWPEGNLYELRWTPTAKQVPSIQFVDVTVVDVNGSTIATLAKDYNNSGYAYWLPSAIYGNRIYGKLKIKVCQTGTAKCDMSDDYFTITRAQASLPPVIDSITTPPYVSAGAVEMWTVNAHDPENKPLTFAALWGDEATYAAKPLDSAFGKYSLLNHKYASQGTYTARFFAKDDAGQVHSVSVTVQVQPSNPYGVDACRVDELNGRNITRGAINDRDICLRKFCDIYGPGNLQLFPSKCVFMGQEIKRYEKSLPKAASAELLDVQGTYTAGQSIKINMRGMTTDGVVGAPDKGFNVQARLESTSSETVQVDGQYQAVNANFNAATGNWEINFKTPLDTAPTYTVDAAFYCSTPGRGCATNQINQTATFTLLPVVPATVPN